MTNIHILFLYLCALLDKESVHITQNFADMNLYATLRRYLKYPPYRRISKTLEAFWMLIFFLFFIVGCSLIAYYREESERQKANNQQSHIMHKTSKEQKNTKKTQ